MYLSVKNPNIALVELRRKLEEVVVIRDLNFARYSMGHNLTECGWKCPGRTSGVGHQVMSLVRDRNEEQDSSSCLIA